MSQYGAGKCVLCGAVDDYCQIGAYQDIDCRDLACMFRQATDARDHLVNLLGIRDGHKQAPIGKWPLNDLCDSVDEYRSIVSDQEELRRECSRFENEDNSG